MKCCTGCEQGAINSARRVREDFKGKVTLALKAAAEVWRVGGDVTGKVPPSRGTARLAAQ